MPIIEACVIAVSGAVASVVLGSLWFASTVDKRERDEDRTEQIRAQQREEEARELAFQAEKKAKLAARFASLPVIDGKARAACPGCGETHKGAGHRQTYGRWIFDRLSKGDVAAIREQVKEKTEIVGPSTPWAVTVGEKQLLYQACTWCLYEWLVDPGEAPPVEEKGEGETSKGKRKRPIAPPLPPREAGEKRSP